MPKSILKSSSTLSSPLSTTTTFTTTPTTTSNTIKSGNTILVSPTKTKKKKTSVSSSSGSSPTSTILKTSRNEPRPKKKQSSSSSTVDSMMKSPVGVADFLQVDPLAMLGTTKQRQEQQPDDGMNSSFSWVECPIPVDPSPIRSTSSWARTGTSSSSRGGRNPTFSSTVNKTTPTSSVATRMRQMEDRLQWLVEQRAKDQDDYQRQLIKAKQEAKEEFYRRHAKTLGRTSRDDGSNDGNGDNATTSTSSSTSYYDDKVSETSKVINYLKQDNAKIREEMKVLKRNIQKIKIANEDLEQANGSAQASIEQLQEHIFEMDAAQQKLKTNTTIFQQTLSTMKKDYHHRTQCHKMESKTVTQYETCLGKVLDHVQQSVSKSSSSRSSSSPADLERQLWEMTIEGSSEVLTGRAGPLSKAGLDMDVLQRQQIERLAHPELLISYHHAKTKHPLDDDDDDDDDDDSEKSVSSRESEYEMESSDDTL